MKAFDPRYIGKLMPKWEGPYKIKEFLRPGLYKLACLDSTEINSTWHGNNSGSTMLDELESLISLQTISAPLQ